MANLVGSSVAQVVLRRATSGNGGGQNDDTIIVKRVGTGSNTGREVGVSKVLGSGHEVDVKISVGALAERPLHGELGSIVGIVRVNGPVNTSLHKGDVVRSKSGVENSQLPGQGGLGKVASRNGVGGGKHMPVDVDLDRRSLSGGDLELTGASLALHEVQGDFILLLARVGSSASALGNRAGCRQQGGKEGELEQHCTG